MTRELGMSDLARQYEAFVAYSARGGPLSLEEWMETKDLADEDRTVLRAAGTLAKREAS